MSGDNSGVPTSQEVVFHDQNLIYCIAQALSPRGRLRLSTLTHTCAHTVDAAEFWTSIHWNVVGGDDPGRKTAWTYSEAALFGNRLGCVLRQYGRHCTRIHLANCPWLQVTGLEDLARCTNLVHLDVSGCSSYSSDLLGRVVRHCPSLRSLNARGCSRIGSQAIIQELFDTPAQFTLNLEHLDLGGVPFTQDEFDAEEGDLGRTLARLARDRLVTLRLGWRGESVPGEEYYRGSLREVLRLVGRCGDTLRLLDMPGCGLPTTPDGVAILGAAFRELRQLRVLCLSNSYGWLGFALRDCPTTQLVHLNLRAQTLLRDQDLAPLLSANPGLRSINVGCCQMLTDATLWLLGTACTRLEALDVCYATSMSAAGVRSVVPSLPRLTDFGFSGFTALLDVDITDIVGRLPKLRMLGLGGIPRLTDASLRAIAAAPCAPCLETLYAADLPNVTPEGLKALLLVCPRLRRVNMRGCGQLRQEDKDLLSESYKYEFDGDVLPYEVVAAENEFAAAAGARGGYGGG